MPAADDADPAGSCDDFVRTAIRPGLVAPACNWREGVGESWRKNTTEPCHNPPQASQSFYLSEARDLIKSASSLSWALALLALQQVPIAFTRRGTDVGGLPGKDFLDRMQRGMAALTSDIFTLDACTPHFATGAVLELMLASDHLIRGIIADGDASHRWQEVQNKLQVFHLFAHADTMLGIVPDNQCSLSEWVRKAEALGPYHSVWATEGLGYLFTNLKLGSRVLPRGLLQKRDFSLPKPSMLPLHAGMGLSLARFLLRSTSSGQELVDRFVETCRANSHEEYLEVAYESLGFACRSLFPQFVGPIHRCLSDESHPLLPFFWHGVGRAIYFSPLNFIPLRRNRWSGVRMCAEESPTALAQCNALAGYFWAMNLVNIRHPEIVSVWLENHAHEMPQPHAFSHGIYSSAIAWRDAAPDDESLEVLAHFHPHTSALADIWRTHVSQPLRRACGDYQALSKTQRIGTLFCAQIS